MKARIVIECDVDEAGQLGKAGKMNFEAPLHDKKLCYDMLALAGEAVRKFNDQPNQVVTPGIVVPGGFGEH